MSPQLELKKHGFVIRTERPLLDFAVTWSEEVRRAAFNRKRVEMLPAVFFGGDKQVIISGPAKSLRHRCRAP